VGMAAPTHTMGEGVNLRPEVFSLHAHLHANVTSLGRTVNPPRLYPPSFNPSPLRISTLRCALIFKVEHDFAVQFTQTGSHPTSKTDATSKHHISDRTHKRDQTRPDQTRNETAPSPGWPTDGSQPPGARAAPVPRPEERRGQRRLLRPLEEGALGPDPMASWCVVPSWWSWPSFTPLPDSIHETLWCDMQFHRRCWE